jgi:hypothetical protein
MEVATMYHFVCISRAFHLRRVRWRTSKVFEDMGVHSLGGSCGVWLDRFEKARFYASRRTREFLKLEAQTLIPATNIGYANCLTLDTQ